jgi:hypothetical protein
MNRRRWLFAVVLTLLSGSALVRPLGAEPPAAGDEKLPAILSAKPLKPEPGDDELHKLLQERYNAAVAEMQDRYREFQAGRGTVEVFGETAQRLVRAGLELSDKPADRIALLTDYVALTKEIEKINQARYDAGRIPHADLEQARYQRLDAEIQLLHAKRKAKPSK